MSKPYFHRFPPFRAFPPSMIPVVQSFGMIFSFPLSAYASGAWIQDLSQLLTQPRARMPGKTSGTAPRYESIEAALTEVHHLTLII